MNHLDLPDSYLPNIFTKTLKI